MQRQNFRLRISLSVVKAACFPSSYLSALEVVLEACVHRAVWRGRPTVALPHSHNAHMIKGTSLCHWRLFDAIAWFSIRLKLPLNRSNAPNASGCEGVLKRGVQPIKFKKVVVKLPVNLQPQPDEIIIGTRKRVTNTLTNRLCCKVL
jgi:hypothetical protein